MLFPILNGLSQGALLFLAASGLSLVFGVLGILNFAHGGFFALGAFVTYSLASGAQLPAWQFVGLVVVASILVGVLGILVEMTVFRRIYHLPPLDALLATYAVLLTTQGAITQIWGVNPLGLPLPDGFRQAWYLADASIPVYDLLLIGVGFLVGGGLWYLLERTNIGLMVRAIAADRTMAASLGINVRMIFTLMFGLGTALAGLGGGLLAPLVLIDTSLAAILVIQAFAVVIVGGLGSMLGAFIAAIFLGLLNSILVSVDPELAGYSLYIGMAAILMVRPQGLMGTPLELRR